MTGTAGAAVAAGAAALQAAGCDTPRLDAELLVADAIGVDRAALLADPRRELGAGVARLASEHIERRARREPVAYILGRRAFRRLELVVDRCVLIPRPETELVVELALELAPHGARVHDVGTGSGAIALALKDEQPDLGVSGSDSSEAALAVARRNAERLDLDVELTVHGGLPPGRYDLVLANLPYVGTDEWPGLAPELREFEPREAFVAGHDGLAAIPALVRETPPGTLLVLEHGATHGPAVRALLRGPETHRDLAGHERVTVGLAP